MAHDTTHRAARGRRAPATPAIALAFAFLASCACPERNTRSIVAGGDCLLDRYDGADPSAPAADARWGAIASACAGSDAFLCNLETTVGRAGTARNAQFTFRAPETALAPLLSLPRPTVSLANNHAMDYGPDGLLATVASLDAVGIAYAGAGWTGDLACGGITRDLSGIHVAYLSFGFDNDPASYSDAQGACIAPIDVERMVRAVSARARESALTVVAFHWGNEYDARFTVRQREIAYRLADEGADVIIGTGPHVLQGIERYHGTLICYSLGNLVFDDLGSRETTATVLVRMSVSGGKGKCAKRFEIAPLRTTRVFEGPRVPTREDSDAIARAVAERSPDPGIIALRPHVDDSGIAWYPVRD